MPTRKRMKSLLPKEAIRESIPWLPAELPPLRMRSRPKGRSSSSWTTSVRSSGTPYFARNALAATPERFIMVCGLASTSSRSPIRTRPVKDFAARSVTLAACRRASSSTTRKPMLCRDRSYSRPAFPSPITSQRSAGGGRAGLRRDIAPQRKESKRGARRCRLILASLEFPAPSRQRPIDSRPPLDRGPGRPARGDRRLGAAGKAVPGTLGLDQLHRHVYRGRLPARLEGGRALGRTPQDHTPRRDHRVSAPPRDHPPGGRRGRAARQPPQGPNLVDAADGHRAVDPGGGLRGGHVSAPLV